ncbi:MAG: AsnC family transcriptional regulator [Thermoproteota archaeon]|nr:AsnC family transcriptional regulator [Thermoproteota archaeon]
MPVDLDGTDIAILKSLMENGRKSFRAISREIEVSTPTVKSRYERLVNIGLIKSVKPEIDLSKVNKGKQSNVFEYETIKELEKQKKHFHVKLDKNMKVKMQCEYCGGPIHAKPKILEFANFQSFFCCTGCKNHYKEKHEGRIQSIVEQYKEVQKEAKK